MESKEKNILFSILKEDSDLKSVVYNNMDDRNKKAFDILADKDKTPEQALKEAAKHMFTDDKTGKPLSYPEMRYRYG